MHVRQRLQFKPAACAENENARIFRCALGQQDAGHGVQIRKAGHEVARAVGITRDRLRIAERRQQFAHDA